MGHGRLALRETGYLTIGEVDGVREEGLAAEPAGSVVDIEVVARLGEPLGDRGHLAAVLGEVRLPVGPVVVRQRG